MRRNIALTFAALTLAMSACIMPAARTSQYASVGGTAAPSADLSSAPELSNRSTAGVARYVNARRDQFQVCRDDALLRGVTMPTGTATIEVTLAEDGYVLRARVTERAWTGEGDAAALEECMLTTVRRWVFPKNGTFDQYIHSFEVKVEESRTARR